MRAILPLAILLAVPFGGALPLTGGQDAAGDEFLTAPPLLLRTDAPALMPPGACGAPGIDILAMSVDHGAGALTVSLTLAERGSRAFTCEDLLGPIDEPSYSVDFYGGVVTSGPGSDIQLILSDSASAWGRCWGYYSASGWFFPVPCALALDGNTVTWTLTAESVAPFDLEGRAIGRAESPVGALWIQDIAE